MAANSTPEFEDFVIWHSSRHASVFGDAAAGSVIECEPEPDAASQPGPVASNHTLASPPRVPRTDAGVDVGVWPQSRGHSQRQPTLEAPVFPRAGEMPSRVVESASSTVSLGSRASWPKLTSLSKRHLTQDRSDTAGFFNEEGCVAHQPNEPGSEAASPHLGASGTSFQSPALSLHARDSTKGGVPFPWAVNRTVCVQANTRNVVGSRHTRDQSINGGEKAQVSDTSSGASSRSTTMDQLATLNLGRSNCVPVRIDSDPESSSDGFTSGFEEQNEFVGEKMHKADSVRHSAKRVPTGPLSASRPTKARRMISGFFSDLPSPSIIQENTLRRAQAWRSCISTAVDESELNVQGILQTFEGAPPRKDIGDVLRALQCICEVARPERVVALQKLLLQVGMEPLLREPFPPSSIVEDLCELHGLIVKFTNEPSILRSKALIYLYLYHKRFESDVDLRKERLKTERQAQKRRLHHARKYGKTPDPSGQTAPKRKGKADQQVREDLIMDLREAGYDCTVAEEQVARHLRIGAILASLLESGERPLHPYWLILITPQVDEIANLLGTNPPPVLNLNKWKPPEIYYRLSRPILDDDVFGLTLEFATWIGKYLFVARPELGAISFDGINIFGGRSRPIPICSMSEKEICDTAPSEISRLFE
ncbi:transcription factor jumonji aspartyl beta-hydroxylase [Diplodia corticola]|uniref:Transcription factor jumonji aspartyl beta-hydroxylase n=1 Tax=Diplodia corticola TaxID=236234 RepID=A0A1J9QWY5_9PEZI|nr:transcription factor jumonji aspartyl beta-hydroxylase [Diplodia corticola]OJD32498.1 transcription factor jumonji aspartyl beta-hydroxylase [Diplodia corticola]